MAFNAEVESCNDEETREELTKERQRLRMNYAVIEGNFADIDYDQDNDECLDEELLRDVDPDMINDWGRIVGDRRSETGEGEEDADMFESILPEYLQEENENDDDDEQIENKEE